jgi:hypothetical protein
MAVSGTHPQSNHLSKALAQLSVQRGVAFGGIIVVALLAFELFNYSTTEYALRDLLGNLRFIGIPWATILSIAFCGIDFAGIARLFTPGQDTKDPGEVWYLFGAWLLAATMNAILTWWGVAMAVANHSIQSASVMDPGTVIKVVPVFVAVMVWLIRILIIGTLSYAGDRFLAPADRPRVNNNPLPVRTLNNQPIPANPASFANMSAPSRTTPRPVIRPEAGFPRAEPTYHTLNAHSANSGVNAREPISPDTRR